MASKKPRRVSLQLRRDSAANWEANNPVLLDGEEVLVYTSTGAVRRKIGDGIAHYSEIPYDDERISAALAQKQDKITGTQGQIVGFDSNGNASAQQVLADDVYFLDGDTVEEKMEAKQDKLVGTRGQIVWVNENDEIEASYDGMIAIKGAAAEEYLAVAHANGRAMLLFVDADNGTFELNDEGNECIGQFDLRTKEADFTKFTSFSMPSPTTDESAATKGYVDNLAPHKQLVTLTSSGWNSSTKQQTVAVNGILADESRQLIQPVPAVASQAAYVAASILCTGQAANSLTFTAKTVPTANLSVYVVWQEVL